MKAIFAGTFDPPTLGHWDVIERASPLFTTLYVVVANNMSKNPLLTVAERVDLLQRLIAESSIKDRCEVVTSNGLVADLCEKQGVRYLVRGVRSTSDFEHELPMSVANEVLTGGAFTLLIPSTKEHSYVSSSLVREIHLLGGDISAFVPELVQKFLQKMKGLKK